MNRFALAAGIYLSTTLTAGSVDIQQNRECRVSEHNSDPAEFMCAVTGGMQGGTVDLGISLPDGRTFSLEGPTDGEDGNTYLLDGRAAASATDEAGMSCYVRTDGKLSICFGEAAP